MRNARRTVLLSISALALFVGGFVALRHPTLATTLAWFRGAGPFGMLAFAAAYVLGVALFVPNAILATIAGFLFGETAGTLLAVPTAVMGATTGFALARIVGREPLAPLIAGRPRLLAVDRAVATDGLRMIALLRLATFIPHNMLNYVLAFTGVSWRAFAVATLIGGTPIVLVQVYAGSLVRSATEIFSGGHRPTAWVATLSAIGLLAAGAAVATGARAAKRELSRLMVERSPEAG